MALRSEIVLTQGQIALVDEDKFEYLSQWKWYARFNAHTNSFYAQRHATPTDGGHSKLIQMHRFICNPSIDKFVDHKNGNTLDNRASNLRVCTNSQNLGNKKMQKDNTSGYRGIYRTSRAKSWYSEIMVEGKRIYLGVHPTKIEAARAYDTAAIKYFGEFARLNLPTGDEHNGI